MRKNTNFPILKYTTIAITSMLFLSFFSAFASAYSINTNDVSIKYVFDEPSLNKIKLDNNWYTLVTMRDIFNYGDPGAPYLPVKISRILIPIGKKISDIKVIPGEKVLLASNLKIHWFDSFSEL